MNWKDARVLIDKGKMPKIPLSLPQIVFLAMDDFTTSTLATAWYTLTTIVIVVNIVVIILQSLSGYTDESQSWFALINDWCVNIFILEYFTKAFCSMYCPIALFDSAWMLDHVLPYGDHEHLVANSLHTTKWQRLSHWACTVNNVVDFVSITPKLLSVAVSGMHLPLASLRMLRLLRIIRVFRAFRAVGKWVTTLQVLSEAFMSSLGSVFVLVLYIGLFSMVAGAVLYSEEGETDDRFRTVPSAIAYVTERFVGDSFSITETLVGGLVLASVGVFKAPDTLCARLGVWGTPIGEPAVGVPKHTPESVHGGGAPRTRPHVPPLSRSHRGIGRAFRMCHRRHLFSPPQRTRCV